jgi:hypothetical protein
MKIIKIVPFMVGAVLSFSAAAATVVTTSGPMDPVTGVWHATTGVVGGVGAAATGLWNGAVYGTKAAIGTTTAVHHAGTTAVHHSGTTAVHHSATRVRH